MSKGKEIRWGRCLGVVLAVVVVAAGAARAQTGRGMLSGALVDREGNPVGKFQLLLRPTGGGPPTKLKSDAKGRFSHGFLPTGNYVLEAKDPEAYLSHFEIVVMEPTGVELNRWESDAHPETGLPPIQISIGLKLDVTVVVADAAYRAKMRQAMAWAESSGPLEKALQLYDAGDMQGVLTETERVLAEQPELGFGRFLRGVALSRLGSLQESEAELRRALELDPGLTDGRGALGTLLLELGQRAAASGEEDRAASYNREAAELLEQQLEMSEQPAPALWTNLVLALERSGQQARAIEVLERMIELQPDYAAAYYHLADLYRQTENGEERALALLERVPESEESSADVIYNLAVQRFNAGDYQEALEILGRALKVDPEFALAHHLAGRIYLALSDYEGAVRELGLFLEMAPDHPSAEEDRQLLESLQGAGD